MGAMEKAIFLGHYESRYSFDLCTFLKIPFFYIHKKSIDVTTEPWKYFNIFKGLMEDKTKQLWL